MREREKNKRERLLKRGKRKEGESYEEENREDVRDGGRRKKLREGIARKIVREHKKRVEKEKSKRVMRKKTELMLRMEG